jgi:UDP-N-acetylglucosamine--N-acetylmuramyl-(pentapeptide) pyrophosphoryl-undecaprenol N-acetylglucosamine transferase
VESSDTPFVAIEAGKLRRYPSVENLIDFFRIPVGIAQSFRQIARFQPDVVLATGGYVAVPPVIAAWMQHIPIVIHEQTVQIGLANRISAYLAARIAVSYESALDQLPEHLRRKAVVTGNPVRTGVFGGCKDDAIRWAGFDPTESATTVYITGGSQGARLINRTVESILPEVLRVCRVIHQCGEQPPGDEQDYDRLERAAASLPPEMRRRYRLVRFIAEEIPHVFALADLVVGRAGAGTVAEICALGKPAIYIPLVPTGGDEQTRNARMCERAGGAKIISQDELSGERLLCELTELLSDRSRLDAMGKSTLGLARPDAANTIASILMGVVGGS